jgi:hypothetical protein
LNDGANQGQLLLAETTLDAGHRREKIDKNPGSVYSTFRPR